MGNRPAITTISTTAGGGLRAGRRAARRGSASTARRRLPAILLTVAVMAAVCRRAVVRLRAGDEARPVPRCRARRSTAAARRRAADQGQARKARRHEGAGPEHVALQREAGRPGREIAAATRAADATSGAASRTARAASIAATGTPRTERRPLRRRRGRQAASKPRPAKPARRGKTRRRPACVATRLGGSGGDRSPARLGAHAGNRPRGMGAPQAGECRSARQSAANAVPVDLGDKGMYYRIQAGPLPMRPRPSGFAAS